MSAAAVSVPRPGGMATARSAERTTRSAYEPGMPVQATRSPSRNAVTPGPSPATTPAPSWPGTNGSGFG